MTESEKLYYTAPEDYIFEELKQEVISLRIEIDPEFHHEKTTALERIQNVRDNFMYIFGTLDMRNQLKIFKRISKKCQEEINKRLPTNYWEESFSIMAQFGLL